MSSYFIYNEACPRCRSKGEDTNGDNLAVYSDGHKWCYKCRFYVVGDKLHGLKPKHREQEFTLKPPPPQEFSKECLEYLKQYGLTDDEIEEHLQGHSDGYAFVDSKFFLIRRLNRKPKVIVEGNVVGNEPVFINDSCKDTIVLCEDILSAIKISRVMSSCALLKTSLHDLLIFRLAKHFNHCVLWLDPDMYNHMTNNLLTKLQPYFTSVKVVLSDKDPKFYSTEEINEYLSNRR